MSEPSQPASFVQGAAVGLAASTIVLFGLAGGFTGTGLPAVVDATLGVAVGLACFTIAALVVRHGSRIVGRLPARILVFLGAAAISFVAIDQLGFGWRASLFYPAAACFAIAQAVLAGVFWAFRKGEPVGRTILALSAGAILFDLAFLAFLAWEGREPFPVRLEGLEIENGAPAPVIDLPSPAERGSHRVSALSYGSGNDRRRPEFGREASWTSSTIDASKLLPQWKGFRARMREWYWGFSLKEAPINGRVWLPEGDGPFPLVLVAHGNHRMEEHSDPGYAYLGELLASRGFITVSVDENFINGSWSGDFRGKEMPLRAYLLLEHLAQWRSWNETKGHRVEGKVDLGKVALAGHSRGGEAIAIAAAFNRLSHFPDDATIPFDYGFGIQSLVSIAQIDERYSRRIELQDVNFLSLHGSYDSDEVSFFGLRQLRRIEFRDGAYRFKTGVYLHGANHGQFNTVWGRTDAGPPRSWLLNLAPIVPGDTQRRVAAVYISAFLEATLHGKLEYVPLFRDPRSGRNWLPEALLVPQFSDSSTRTLADFEEDLDVTTATLPGARIETSGLERWKEEELLYRDDQKQGTSAVIFGGKRSGDASYTIRFPPSTLRLANDAFLTFSLGLYLREDATAGRPEIELELEDSGGRSAAVPLRGVAALVPPLRIRLYKLPRWSGLDPGRDWEPTLQRYEIPLSSFLERNAALSSELAAIRFRLRGDDESIVVLDDLGVRSPALEDPQRHGRAEGEESERRNGPAKEPEALGGVDEGRADDRSQQGSVAEDLRERGVGPRQEPGRSPLSQDSEAHGKDPSRGEAHDGEGDDRDEHVFPKRSGRSRSRND
jgi:predicted dienelactone hydrolase